MPKPRNIDWDLKAKARLLIRDIQRALKECDVAKAERLAREAMEGGMLNHESLWVVLRAMVDLPGGQKVAAKRIGVSGDVRAAVRGLQAMSDPREQIQEAIKAARRIDARDWPTLEILARCAEALLDEHYETTVEGVRVRICAACEYHLPCPVLLEIVQPAKEEA